MSKLYEKIALITGSSSGIGRAVSIAFAEEGAHVAINHPAQAQEEQAHEVRSIVEKSGRKALVVQADVSKEDQVKNLVHKVMEEFGRIDILVNNAGIATSSPIEEMSAPMWDELMAVNLRSVFLCTRQILPIMYRQNYGKIVNTASQLAYRGSPGFAHYCAAKAAIIAFTRSLSLEIGSRDINANCVAPGATETPMLEGISQDTIRQIRASIPRGRLATVDEIAPTYVFLASDESRHYVGQCLSPNGGDVML
jgi:3-oxoacyl-[acyl-carrier protein] reductase